MKEKPIGMVPLPGCRCRCGHEWLPRDAPRSRACAPSAKVRTGTGPSALRVRCNVKVRSDRRAIGLGRKLGQTSSKA